MLALTLRISSPLDLIGVYRDLPTQGPNQGRGALPSACKLPADGQVRRPDVLHQTRDAILRAWPFFHLFSPLHIATGWPRIRPSVL
jgi:hypothetical protein